jgi:general secretion pathway protein C
MRQLPTLTSFVVFLALCASITYWLLQWMAPASRPLATPIQAEYPLPDVSAAADLFGGANEALGALPIQLKGIILANHPNESVAIIALNGKPARALKASAVVSDGILIKQITAGGVILVDHDTEHPLSLPIFSVPMAERPPLLSEPANK